MQIFNMHCYLMQWLLTTASTLNVFCSAYKVFPLFNSRSSMVWLIFPKASGASSVQRRVQWGWDFCWGTMKPIVTVRVLWHPSISACDACHPQQPQNNDCQSHWLFGIYELQLWNEIKLNVYLLHEALVKKADGVELSHKCFSPQHIRCSLNSMVLAHKWLIPCRHKTCLTSEWHFTSNFILRWATEWTRPGFVNTKIKLLFHGMCAHCHILCKEMITYNLRHRD